MRICKIWDADYPWDIRIDKVATSLAAAGHDVHLVCRNLARRERCEWNGQFTVHRLPKLPSLLAPVDGLWNFPYPLNPVWFQAIESVIRGSRSEMILVRDILLAIPAAILGKVHGIPVILDMAENYPAMLQDRIRYSSSGLLSRLIRHPRAARLVERLSIALVDHIIVVVEESRERLVKAGVPPEKLTIVCNTPRLEQWKFLDKHVESSSSNEGLNLVYLGNLDGSRGLDVVIRAIRYLKDLGHHVKVSIVGDGPSIQFLRALARDLDVESLVEILGRRPFPEVQAIMARAHIGLIPHYSTAAWRSTIPNKLFDYMSLGLAVIVSDAKPTARVVRTEKCGEVFRDRDEVDLARCIMALMTPKVRAAKGRNGQAGISRLYNWQHDSRILIDTVERVKTKHHKEAVQ